MVKVLDLEYERVVVPRLQSTTVVGVKDDIRHHLGRRQCDVVGKLPAFAQQGFDRLAGSSLRRVQERSWPNHLEVNPT